MKIKAFSERYNMNEQKGCRKANEKDLLKFFKTDLRSQVRSLAQKMSF